MRMNAGDATSFKDAVLVHMMVQIRPDARIFAGIEIKPVRGLIIKGPFLKASHGNEYQYTDGHEAELFPFMQDVTWEKIQFSGTIQYEFLAEAYLFLDYSYSNISTYDADGKTAEYYMNLYTPSFFQGKLNTVTIGFNFGF